MERLRITIVSQKARLIAICGESGLILFIQGLMFEINFECVIQKIQKTEIQEQCTIYVFCRGVQKEDHVTTYFLINRSNYGAPQLYFTMLKYIRIFFLP